MRNAEPKYLRPRIKIEPLTGRWPVWPHLLAPACHAMNVAFRHLPHLKSFAATPSVHIAASADPAMFGGPFVSLKLGDVARVRQLIEQTTSRCAPMLAFAEAFRALDAKLQAGAKGYSLDDHYQSLPAVLAGLVELVYDLNNTPRLKIREEFTYDGPLRDSAVEEVCLHEVSDTGRDFFMSTPLLESPSRAFLQMRFDDPLLDELAAARVQPLADDSLEKRLQARLSGDAPAERELLSRLFTPEPPERTQPIYSGPDVRIRYFGHACVLLQTDRTSILIDPVTAWERDQKLAKLTFHDLPDRIDQVVLTHCHQDHLVAEVLMQLRSRVGRVIVPHNDWGNLADPSMRLILRRLGLNDVVTLDPMQEVSVADGNITSLPFSGEHAGLDINSKQCLAIRLKGRTILFLVDSDGIDPALYRRVAPRLDAVDGIFIGMECRGAPLSWLYGSLLGKPLSRRDDESRRLSGSDSERAWRILETFGARRVFVYAMGQEPWMRHLMGLEYAEDSVQLVESRKLVERCRQNGIAAQVLKGCTELMF